MPSHRLQGLQRPPGFEGGRFGEASLPGRKPVTVPTVTVPVPTKPRSEAPGARGPRHRYDRYDRLQGGHLKGIIARDNLREFIQGSDPKLGRWSNNKAIYTELLQVMQTCSVAKLISSLSQAQAAGANNWPEFAKANGRLRDLEDIRHNMEEASDWICIKDMERLMSRASDVGIICYKNMGDNPKSIQRSFERCVEPEFQHLVFALEKRMQKLSSLKEDLRKCCLSSDMDWISNTLKVAREVGGEWEEFSDAQVRLQMLQTSLAKMTELLGDVRSDVETSQLKERMHQVLTSLQHIDEDPPPPLGLVLKALRVQYNHLRLEDVAGLRDRLTREMLAAEKNADLELLRAAVAEADTQSFMIEPSSPLPGASQAVRWEELDRGRRCLAQLVEIEAELESVVAARAIPPSPIAIIAAISRADACGCSSWNLRSAASARLRQVQSLEAKILKAVQAGSEDLLREAMTDVHSAGFASWPLLHAAIQLVKGSNKAGPEESAPLWQSFTSTTTSQRLLVELPEAERFGGGGAQVGDVEVAFVGIRLEGADRADDSSEEPEELPPLEILVERFQKVTGETPYHARLTLVRSGLAVLEVRLQRHRERFSGLLEQLSTNQVFDFGPKVKVAQHLYSFVTRWTGQEQQQAMLSEIQRASSPGGETSVTKTSFPSSSAHAEVLTQEVIHRELELLREFATPASASAVCVKTTSGPGSLVEEVAAGTSELLVEEVLRKQIADGLTPVLKRRDDSISVVSEATDVESAQLLRLIQTEFQLQREALCQETKSDNCLDELLDASPESQCQKQEAVIAKQLSRDLISGAHHLPQEEHIVDGVDAVDQEDALVTEDLSTKHVIDAVKTPESGGHSPVEEMSCSSGPDDYTQEFVAKNVLKNAFQMLQDTEEGIDKRSDISELSNIENDAAREVAQKLQFDAES